MILQIITQSCRQAACKILVTRTSQESCLSVHELDCHASTRPPAEMCVCVCACFTDVCVRVLLSVCLCLCVGVRGGQTTSLSLWSCWGKSHVKSSLQENTALSSSQRKVIELPIFKSTGTKS